MTVPSSKVGCVIRLFAILTLAFATTACGGRSSRTTGPTPISIDFGNNIPSRVTAIGDSITAGVVLIGAETGGSPYPPRLQNLLRARNPQAQVINRGVGGQRTDGGLGTVDFALGADRPGFMTIMEGTNDVRQFVPDTIAAANLREMVRRAKANKTVPILATIPRQLGSSTFFADDVVSLNVMIRQVASQENVILADVFAALPDETFFLSDGFHPSSRGNDAIAVTFDSALMRAGYPIAQLARRAR